MTDRSFSRRPLLLVFAAFAAVSLLISLPAPVAAAAGLSAAEQEVLDLVNEERARNGLGPLVATQTLNAAAAWLAQDLATIDGLDHTDTLGRGLRDRLNAFDYPSNSTIRENIAAGYPTPAAAVEGWINSPGHYTNMLAAEAQAAGVALYEAPGTTYRYFWVFDFGSMVDTPLPSAVPTSTAQPVQIVGTVPGLGVGLMVAQEAASPAQLIATVQVNGGCANAAVWITSDGAFIGYLAGAPAFVNKGFPVLLPAGSPFLVSCS